MTEFFISTVGAFTFEARLLDTQDSKLSAGRWDNAEQAARGAYEWLQAACKEGYVNPSVRLVTAEEWNIDLTPS